MQQTPPFLATLEIIFMPHGNRIFLCFSFFLCTAKVGKTSLIMSLVSEEFPDEV